MGPGWVIVTLCALIIQLLDENTNLSEHSFSHLSYCIFVGDHWVVHSEMSTEMASLGEMEK